jgi:hypothetical protein
MRFLRKKHIAQFLLCEVAVMICLSGPFAVSLMLRILIPSDPAHCGRIRIVRTASRSEATKIYIVPIDLFSLAGTKLCILGFSSLKKWNVILVQKMFVLKSL